MRSTRSTVRRGAIAFCGLLAMLLSGCGGGNSGGGPARMFTSEILCSFGNNSSDATAPDGELIQASDGNFYGTTSGGGVNGAGTVFQITPAGAETVLHSFAGGPSDGANPDNVRLIQDSDGSFLGTTSKGAGYDQGAIFRLSPEGIVTVLHSFAGAPSDGHGPGAGLLQGSDGNFYGTTVYGGTNNLGTVFQLTPAGVYTVLYSFGSGNDVTQPASALVEGSDGNYYGVADAGGTKGEGGLFKVTPEGVETVLHSFAAFFGPIDGSISYPLPAHLLKGSDGNFYGTTVNGGAYGDIQNNGFGAVFELAPNGVVTILHSFSGPPDGANPMSGLIQGTDGTFYGTTSIGGADGAGTVYEITPEGNESVLYSFAGGPGDGEVPTGNLIEGNDGHLYGTTARGGANGHGTFFRLVSN
jgi:uncharacterized repeat protein (TIGR03803 family)